MDIATIANTSMNKITSNIIVNFTTFLESFRTIVLNIFSYIPIMTKLDMSNCSIFKNRKRFVNTIYDFFSTRLSFFNIRITKFNSRKFICLELPSITKYPILGDYVNNVGTDETF